MQLDYNEVSEIVDVALNEDIGRGDITTLILVPPTATANFKITAEEPLVVCGVDIIRLVLQKFDVEHDIRINYKDGDLVEAGAVLVEGSGNAQVLLASERVILNFIQITSGIATMTRRYVSEVQGTNAKVLDTRKTFPGLRSLQKYAVTVGGGHNHRLRLDDGVLIKDNHIELCGSISKAVDKARSETPSLTRVEVECDNLEQLQEALESSADVILLDNMPPEILKKAVEMNNGKKALEASGGISLQNIREVAQTGVDYISIGRLTRTPHSADITMHIERMKQ
jgi:nicotinate-nucleotide pyrophosphorylase (carboxylating)